MKTPLLWIISLMFLFYATAYADMGQKSCYLNDGPKFESKTDDHSMPGHDEEMMMKHHGDMHEKHMMMKKMEKQRDMIEKEYMPEGSGVFDDYL